jgi:hypothetical protein
MITADQAKPQPNSWTCGPAALRHALLCYQETVDFQLLSIGSLTHCCKGAASDAKLNRDGRCEHGLARAAGNLGYRLKHVLVRAPAEAYKAIRLYLDAGAPVLVCCEHFSHWVTIIRANSRHAWVADSSRDESEHLRRVTWRALLRRVTYGLPDEVRFDLYPLLSAKR